MKSVNKTPLFKLLGEARKLEAQGFLIKAAVVRKEIKTRLRHIKENANEC